MTAPVDPYNPERYPEIGLERLAGLAELDLVASGSVESVLDAVAQAATDLLPASRGASVILWNAASAQYEMASSTVPGQGRDTALNEVRSEGGATRWVLDNESPLIVDDVSQHQLATNKMLVDYGIAAFVAVPILGFERRFGVLYGLDAETRAYTQSDVDFMSLLAKRAASALHAAALLAEVREQSNEYQSLVYQLRQERRRAEATARLANLLISNELGGKTLDIVMDTVAQALSADRVLLATLDHSSQGVVHRVVGGSEKRLVREDSYSELLGGPTGEALESGIAVSGAHELGMQQVAGSSEARLQIDEGPYSVVPLPPMSGLVGTLTLMRRAGRPQFSSQELRLGQVAAAQIGAAIDRSLLFRQVQQLAVTDALTGVANRRRFIDEAEVMLERSKRSQSKLSLLMMDVDQFKEINDKLGHGVGDTVLRTVAATCQEASRSSDVVARIGGDEFAIILPDATMGGVESVGRRIHETLAASNPDGVEVTVSIGGAQSFPSDTVDTLLERADAAMYEAKAHGNPQVEWSVAAAASTGEL
ncbi:MAG: diguanylate cyclase [Acidimicrobiia bacterium]|nr:diguanylate cyclase [Acidimicrobiia bacterium]